MVAEIQLKGFDGIERALTQLPATVAKRLLTSSVRKGANVIAREMKARAPVRQDEGVKVLIRRGRNRIAVKGRRAGYLKASIGVRIKRAAAAAGVPLVLGIGPSSKAFWAGFQEFGTRHQPARPFARPALEAKSEEAVNVIAADLGPKIEAEFKKMAG